MPRAKDNAEDDEIVTPANLLQAWTNAMQEDSRDSDGSEDEEDRSEWETSDSEAEPFGVQVNGTENTVSITYIIGAPVEHDDDDSEEEDTDPEPEEDGGEHSADSDDDIIFDLGDPESLPNVAAVIAEVINEAMVDEAAAQATKYARGGRRAARRGGEDDTRAISVYVPDSQSEEELEDTADARAPVVTRGRRRKAESRGRKGSKAAHRKEGRASSADAGKRAKSGEPDLEKYSKMLGMLEKSVEGKEEGAEMEQALLKEFGGAVAAMKKAKAERDEKAKKKAEVPIRKKNCKQFRRLLRSRSAQHPLEYFSEQPVERQAELLKALETAANGKEESVPYTVRILESKAPEAAKALALRQAAMMSQIADGEEIQKVKKWVEAFTQLPFGIYKELPIRLGQSTQEEIGGFMMEAREKLDKVVYGLDDAKTKLIEVLGQWVANPKSTGCSIALKGPMGTGKTTLIKEGLSKIIGRPFEFIALGGSTDGGTLEGHSFTYVGSTWGEIVSILLRSKCMNPVIYFDELDKISQTPRGQEIAGILTHLTDAAQNNTFSDRYFAGVPLDLSRVVFVFSYNDETLINPILLNRMFKVETKGYKPTEKAVIATEYMLPELMKEFALTQEEVRFESGAIDYLTGVVSGEEKGVRDLRRGLSTCLAKLNLLRLGMPLSKVIGGDSASASKNPKTERKIEFPVVVDRELAIMLAKPPEKKHMHFYT